ncbi:outer membrane protein assembly factor BamB family protein [Paenibacillus spongiae]|uniref:PQQ-binding-like beta-propeller repeat protein n=1 Tax=Paenibacillus spongiae TaxID=2909671 RepID=A0ABY5S5S2_9BACL|nr:PQQ-binding-like beta-propeller repeat protein [Paenibacillus spongiae]UVI29251.1 PQQ-binding-like beta-propeller repeat protein [Paenibacillus spongiae]
MKELEKSDLKQKLFGGKRRILSIFLLGCLLGACLLSWFGLLDNDMPVLAGPKKVSQNPVIYLRETYASTDVNVVAYSHQTGEELWTKSSQYTHTDYLQRSNGLSYVLDGEVIYYISKCKLYSVNATTGQTIWEQDLYRNGQTFCYGKVLLDKAFNRIYVVGTVSTEAIQEIPTEPGEMPLRQLPSTSEPRLLAFQTSTGNQLWQNNTIGYSVFEGMFISMAPFVVNNGFIYTTQSPFNTTADDRKLIAISGENGAILWKDKRVDEEIQSLEAVNGVVYTLTAELSEDREHFERFTLAALQNGKAIWSRPFKTVAQSSLMIANNRIFAQSFLLQKDGSYRVQLHGYNITTGKEEVSRDLGSAGSTASSAMQTDHTSIYMTFDRQHIKAIETETGNVLWTSAHFENIGNVLVEGDKIIFLMRTKTRETFLVALDSTTGQTAWQQPLP